MNQMTRVLLLVLLSCTADAKGDSYSEEVQVVDPSKKSLRWFANQEDYIVDHVSALGYELYGPDGLKLFLTKNNIQFVEADEVNPKTVASYPTPEACVARMQSLQKAYPKLIELIEIGKSVKGRSLIVAKVTAPEREGARMTDRPEFKYIANMHGDEIVGRELMLRLIRDLLTGYGKDGRITRLLQGVQIYIMPSMNPDGAAVQSRFNAKRVDLNRAFPDFTTPDTRNTPSGRAPEVAAVMKFQAKHQFKLSANFHGGSEVINYPWDTTSESFPLESLIKSISLDYTKRVPYMYRSTEFKYGIVKGYDWYEVDGGMQDWSYHWHGDAQVTIELTQTKWPDYSTIDRTYQQNRDALIRYIESVFLL